MTTDIRAALERLIELDDGKGPAPAIANAWTDAIAAARAALAAEPVGEGASDEELLRTYGQAKRDHCYEGDLDDWPKKAERAATVAGIRAVLARWGRPAAPPAPVVQRDAVIAAVTEALGDAYDCLRVWDAWSVGTMGQDDFALVAEDSDRVAEIADAAIEAMRPAAPPASEQGEVKELGDTLSWIAAQLGDIGWSVDSLSVARAADLLQQLSAPAPEVVPVAVAERPWVRIRWCDRLGRCWMGDPGGQGFIPSWRLCRPEDAPSMIVSLPAHAIPLPQVGEVGG